MSTSQATPQDAELILKLYDLRREPVMREARNFVFGFAPQSVDDLLAVANAFGTKENAYVRQVYGYWDMAAALVVHGTLNALLVYDTCHEMYFVYAKSSRSWGSSGRSRECPNSFPTFRRSWRVRLRAASA